MIELEIPESIADFIQGRAPHRVGAKHYITWHLQDKRVSFTLDTWIILKICDWLKSKY